MIAVWNSIGEFLPYKMSSRANEVRPGMTFHSIVSARTSWIEIRESVARI